MTTFTEREFRDALGQIATGVVVVPADVDGQCLGSTMSSFNAVSLTPPLVLFSIARSAQGLRAWQNARHYGISVLGEGQSAFRTGSRKVGAIKWQGLAITRMNSGARRCCQIGLRISNARRYDGGDHEIFVARVDRFEVSRSTANLLAFFKGKYRSLAEDHPLVVAPPLDNVWLHGW